MQQPYFRIQHPDDLARLDAEMAAETAEKAAAEKRVRALHSSMRRSPFQIRAEAAAKKAAAENPAVKEAASWNEKYETLYAKTTALMAYAKAITADKAAAEKDASWKEKYETLYNETMALLSKNKALQSEVERLQAEKETTEKAKKAAEEMASLFEPSPCKEMSQVLEAEAATIAKDAILRVEECLQIGGGL
jgi:hypothetical protein